MKEGLSAKLSDKWTGPYYIVEIGPNHTYKLRNCADHKPLASLVNANRIKLYNYHPNDPFPVPDARQTQRNENNQTQRPVGRNLDATPERHELAPQKPRIRDKTPDHDSETFFPIKRLLRLKRIKGKTHFLVQWEDGSPNTWEPEENILDNVPREYYTTHTRQGKRRRRKVIKFFQQSQSN